MHLTPAQWVAPPRRFLYKPRALSDVAECDPKLSRLKCQNTLACFFCWPTDSVVVHGSLSGPPAQRAGSISFVAMHDRPRVRTRASFRKFCALLCANSQGGEPDAEK